MAKERLQRILAAAGIASRRKCEELILQGAVRVNGRLIDTLPAFADPENDNITVDGRKIYRPKKIYFFLNKPKGVICTNDAPAGRRVVDLIDIKGRIFIVGRLDTQASGAIILTNDSVLADRLTHPRYALDKTYVAAVSGKITPEILEKLKKGIWLSEGKTAPLKIKVLKAGENESQLEIKMKDGLNREIRRIMARVGCKVKTLKRTHLGKISVGKLKPGQYRPLSQAEIKYLLNEL